MKKYTLSILSLSLLLSASVFNTSCSSESDAISETKATTASNIETLNGSMWKQDVSYESYIQFNNGIFAFGDSPTNMPMISKYFLEDGNIIMQTNIGYSAIPYSFRDGKLIVDQYGKEEVYSYYGKAIDITNDFTNYETLYRSNWSRGVQIDNKNVRLTIKFLANGEFKYSYDEDSNPWETSSKLDKTGTYRIEKDKIYMNWNDGNGEMIKLITISSGTLILENTDGLGRDEMRFYQS